jgi:hypothetical protein
MLATLPIKLLMLVLFGMLAKWGYSDGCRSFRSRKAAFALVILLVMMLLGKTL